MSKQTELEKEPIPNHDAWECECNECSAWRERNEPTHKQLTGSTFAEWAQRRHAKGELGTCGYVTSSRRA
jgi:hypothetical protein